MSPSSPFHCNLSTGDACAHIAAPSGPAGALRRRRAPRPVILLNFARLAASTLRPEHTSQQALCPAPYLFAQPDRRARSGCGLRPLPGDSATTLSEAHTTPPRDASTLPAAPPRCPPGTWLVRLPGSAVCASTGPCGASTSSTTRTHALCHWRTPLRIRPRCGSRTNRSSCPRR